MLATNKKKATPLYIDLVNASIASITFWSYLILRHVKLEISPKIYELVQVVKNKKKTIKNQFSKATTEHEEFQIFHSFWSI